MTSPSFRASRSIGLFDSGIGGLTVMREIAALLPDEHLIYFGDTARLPYGNKSSDAILRFALDSSNFLLSQNIKLLLVACHTACAHALKELQRQLPIPVLGVMVPGIEQLLAVTQTNHVAILGTSSTISSGVPQSLLLASRPSLQIQAISCPLFVSFVEEGLHAHPAAKLIVEHYLSLLKNSTVDAVCLACTHYPLLAPLIQEFLGSSVTLIEPAHPSAQRVRKLLFEEGLLNKVPRLLPHRFYVSDNPDKFRRLATIFFNAPIDKVELV